MFRNLRSQGAKALQATKCQRLWQQPRKISLEQLESRFLPTALSFTPFLIPTARASPHAIAVGQDGNLWFTEVGQAGVPGKIGRITTTGAITEFTLPPGSRPGNITAGPDGNLWFTEEITDSTGAMQGAIGRITTAGISTAFALPAGSNQPSGIAAGPDGNVWFCLGASLGRITPGGNITEFSLPLNPNTDATALTTGPDGNLWVLTSDSLSPATGSLAHSSMTQLLVVTPTGKIIANESLPPALGNSITVGPDGNLWSTEGSIGETLSPSDTIGRFTPGKVGADGSMSVTATFFDTPTPDGNVNVISTGPDGNLWFTEGIVDQIGRITPSGVITEFAGPHKASAATYPQGIVTGPDGNLWYVDENADQVIRINLTTAITPTTPNQTFIAHVYLDLLGRQADPSGLSAWSGLLDRGVSRTQVVLDIETCGTQEYQTHEINQAYELLLHRPADPSGLQVGLKELATAGLQAEYAFIAGSPEYRQNRGGGTISGWLSAIYADAVNRAVDPRGEAAFTQELSTGVINFPQAAELIFTSVEYDQDLVDGYYTAFLQRAADSASLAAWVRELQSGQSPEAVIAGILGSPEYFKLTQST